MRDKYKQQQDKKTLHLIVSHGYHVECFATLNGGKQVFPEYCSISGFEMLYNDSNDINLLFDGDGSHVKTKY